MIGRELAFGRARIGLAVLAVVLMAGCAAFRGDLNAPQRVYAAQLELDAVGNQLDAYAALPECAPGVVTACHTTTVLEQATEVYAESAGQLEVAESIAATACPGEIASECDDSVLSQVEFYTGLVRGGVIRIAALIATRRNEG